jgi:hypothetical protein
MRVRSLALLVLAAAAAACGGNKPADTRFADPSKGDGGAAAASTASSAPFVSNVPMAEMPAPFNFGSKKADKKVIAGAAACAAGFKAQAGDLGAEVQKLAKGCADATKMRAVGSVLSGTQAQGAAPQTFKLKAEANHCYRVYGVTAATVKNIEVLVVDSAGFTAYEARSDEPRVLAADDGAVCFRSADDAQLLVSVGAGEGAFALQIWSD